MLHIVQQKHNHNTTIKLQIKNSYNLLENTHEGNGVSNIKFGKLFHQDVMDEQKISL